MKTKTNKNIIRLILTLALSIVTLFACAIAVHADDDPKPKKISRVGKKTVTVTVGEELELKVKTKPADADDDWLRWKIVSGSKYIKFDDDDRNDDEIELIAKKKGTAKIRCYIKGNSKKKVDFTIKVKAAPKKISAVTASTRTVEVGDDFELKVKKYSGLKDKYLTWTIKDKKIVRFDDDDKKGDDVEFKAKKVGTTTITCKNTKTKQTVKFTIKVVKKTDFDDDDDDD